MYIHGSPVEIQSEINWNLIGRSVTAPPPVLSPLIVLPPPSCHFAIISARKISARVSKMLLFQFILHFFMKIL
jgi:hypothetical protein